MSLDDISTFTKTKVLVAIQNCTQELQQHFKLLKTALFLSESCLITNAYNKD